MDSLRTTSSEGQKERARLARHLGAGAPKRTGASNRSQQPRSHVCHNPSSPSSSGGQKKHTTTRTDSHEARCLSAGAPEAIRSESASSADEPRNRIGCETGAVWTESGEPTGECIRAGAEPLHARNVCAHAHATEGVSACARCMRQGGNKYRMAGIAYAWLQGCCARRVTLCAPSHAVRTRRAAHATPETERLAFHTSHTSHVETAARS